MTKENRIKEIIGAMQSFKKDAYHKEELLHEYFAYSLLINVIKR